MTQPVPSGMESISATLGRSLPRMSGIPSLANADKKLYWQSVTIVGVVTMVVMAMAAEAVAAAGEEEAEAMAAAMAEEAVEDVVMTTSPATITIVMNVM